MKPSSVCDRQVRKLVRSDRSSAQEGLFCLMHLRVETTAPMLQLEYRPQVDLPLAENYRVSFLPLRLPWKLSLHALRAKQGTQTC